jgi:hypothetical protein
MKIQFCGKDKLCTPYGETTVFFLYEMYRETRNAEG